MLRILYLSLLASFTLAAPAMAAPASKEKPVAILLHGIMNKSFVMQRIVTQLESEGYEVHNWSYPSTDGLIEDHAKNLHSFVQTTARERPLHFVGFSQGAIIIRYTLTHYKLPHVVRFVMIAPPNHGSEMAEDFYQYAWFRGLYGDRSIKQLFSKQNEFLKSCGIPKVEFGIIAGGKGDDKGHSDRIPGDDDGTISVQSAKLEGAKDFVILDHQHTPLVFASDTVKQVSAFLKNGAFQR